MAPPDLAAKFLEEIAARLKGIEFADDVDEPDLATWGDLTDRDRAALWVALTDDQMELIATIAFSNQRMSAAGYADRLSVSVDKIAGLVGPINKKCKKLGFVSLLRSWNHYSGPGRMERVLELDEHFAVWVRDHYEPETDQ